MAQNEKNSPEHIAIFASGAGSNTKKIIEHFKDHAGIRVALIVCNQPQAGVLDIAKQEGIPTLIIEKNKFFETAYQQELIENQIDFILLAGFLWKIPRRLIKAYPGRIINIHPALLPKYGGKGMYGKAVHAAVIQAGEQKSGMTIHFVDEEYDHGNIILQKSCAVDKDETPESLAKKVQALEHQYFASAIEKLIINLHP